MSRPKSLLKNAKRIAECKTPDLGQEPGQDILQKLREYRASSVMKYASPFKISSKIAKLKEGVPNSQSLRPSTSPYSEVARSGHRYKNSQDIYYQEKSVERLYKGSRILSNNLVDFEADKGLDISSKNIEEYLQSIRVLYPMRFDLELNHEVIKGEGRQSSHNTLGDYYSLKENIDILQGKSPDELKDLNSQEFVKILQDYNRVLRHVLLGLKMNKHDDEAAIVEMLWRVIIKLIDNALILHEQVVIDLNVNLKEKIKSMTKEFKDCVKRLEADLKSQKEEYDKKIEKMMDQIKNLNAAVHNKDKRIQEKDEKMNELLDGTNRDKSCIEMNRILKKLNTYISETEDQQYKQVAALNGISHVMSLAENFDGKPESSLRQVQTSLSMPFSRYPELPVPVLSKNLFYALGEPSSVVPRETVLSLLTDILEESSGDEVFVSRLGKYLIEKFSSKEEILNYLKNIGKVLLHPACNKSKFFARVLGFPNRLFSAFEMALLKISQCLGSVEGRTGEELPLFRVIDLFQTILPTHQTQVQNLLPKLRVLIDFPIEGNKNTWVLISRFYFAFEKTKKPLKFHLETLDSKKEGFSIFYLVTSHLFVDWLKNKLNIWMKDSEISVLINFFGGDIMKTSTILEKFSSSHIEKCKEIYVQREEILLHLIENWEEAQKTQLNNIKFLLSSSSFQEFTEEVSNNGKSLQEDALKSCYFDLILEKNSEKIMRKFSLIDSAGFNLEDIRRLEKKAKTKKNKKK